MGDWTKIWDCLPLIPAVFCFFSMRYQSGYTVEMCHVLCCVGQDTSAAGRQEPVCLDWRIKLGLVFQTLTAF